MSNPLKKISFFLAAIFLISSGILAQTSTLKGTVQDAGGKALSGASVVVDPKNIGTTTDAEGNYTLKIPAGNYILSISFVAWISKSRACSWLVLSF